MKRSTSIEHVHAVLAIDDRVLRNYWVTQSYADLAAGLAAALDPGTANWCTFGVWASCTVGRNLRGEDLPDWLRTRVVRSDGMMGAADTVNSVAPKGAPRPRSAPDSARRPERPRAGSLRSVCHQPL